jgi:hypothetical protein
LLDEVRFSSGTRAYESLLISDAQFARSELSHPAEVRLAPRTIHSATSADGVLGARDLRLQQSVRDVGSLSQDLETRLITKFGLPDLPGVADRLQSATLRFHLNQRVGSRWCA